MALLILDLDLTTFVHKECTHEVHSMHDTKTSNFSARGWSSAFIKGESSVEFINPKELADLIEFAFVHHDGIMILTSGFWERESVLSAFKEKLPLSPFVKEKLKDVLFLSPHTESNYYTKAILPFEAMSSLQKIDKAGRLEIIIEKHELSGKAFVMLDDNKKQLNSFANMPNVFTVHADTKSDSNHFYEEAKLALEEAKAYEMNHLNQNVIFKIT